MNREIKFRAWCTHWKIWGEVDFDVFLENTDSNQKGILEVTHHGKIILMQYTGFKDKNGKEIYEGDLLAWEDRCNPIIYQEKYGWFGWDATRYAGVVFPLGQLFVEEFEVTGNIYENPDLLV